MFQIKSDEEIELLRQSNLLVSATLASVAGMMKPGMATNAIDKSAEEFIGIMVESPDLRDTTAIRLPCASR